MSTVISFGEYMLRLSPPGHERLTQASSLRMLWGGAEANTCAALAQLGTEVSFVTAMPDNDVGRAGINELRRVGVSVADIVRTGYRVGIYYCETGASVRASQVIYDRKHSSVSEAAPSLYSWSKILNGGKWFHTTGITLAISENAREAAFEAAGEAKKNGLTVSFDINYRSKLWSEAEAGKVISEFLPSVDMLFCGYDDLKPMFGIVSPLAGDDPDAVPDEAYLDVSRQICGRYGKKRIVYSMRRTVSADETVYGLRMYDYAADKLYDSARYNIHAVDRIGAGDAADAGAIFASLNGEAPGKTINFAAACGALKHTVEGDITAASLSDVESVMRGGLRVRR